MVKLMTFLKNTPSPVGIVSKDEGVGGTSTRVSISSPSPIVPSAVKTTATVVFGASGLYRMTSLSMEMSDMPGKTSKIKSLPN